MQMRSFSPKQILLVHTVVLKKKKLKKTITVFFPFRLIVLFSIKLLVSSKGAVLFPAIPVLKVVKGHLKKGETDLNIVGLIY